MCWSSTLVVWVGSRPYLGLYLVWGPRSDVHDRSIPGCVYVWSSTLSISENSGPFRALLLAVLGPRGISMIDDPKSAFTCPSSTLTVLANSDPFRGQLLTVLGPQGFPQSFDPKVRLRVGRQHSQFWTILTRFVDYYSLFWGPGVIFTINEPLSAFTCQSLIILGLSDSGLFNGLLLTVLGSQNAFHGCRTQRCAMCWSSTLAVWVGSGPFLGLYLVLGSRSDFHDC